MQIVHLLSTVDGAAVVVISWNSEVRKPNG